MGQPVQTATPTEGVARVKLADDNSEMSDADAAKIAAELHRLMKKDDDMEDDKDEMGAEADKELSVADATLATMIDSHRGETLADEKLRGDLRDMRIKLATEKGGNPTAFVEAGKNLMTAHFAKVVADGADGGTALEHVRRGSAAPGGFDVGRYILGAVREGRTIDSPDLLGGTPEAEMLKGVFGKTGERAEKLHAAFSEARTAARPGASVIPIPLKALGVGGAATTLAQTYGNGSTDVDGYRSPDFRRDLLTMFHRPMLCLDQLGVMQIAISNDINIPRVTAAQVATWVAENAAAPDSDLTLGSTKTTAKRLASKTDISWQLTAAADEIGITPLVVSELNRAIMQAREKATFGEAITNGPTGLAGASGVNDPGVNAQPTTLAHIKAFEQALMDDDIPMDNIRWLLSVADMTALSTSLTYSQSSSLSSFPLFRSAMDVGVMGVNSGFSGFVNGRPACVSNNVPETLGGSNDETMVVAGLWDYLLVCDYMMAFLTIDDISQALNAQTRCTINSYHDVVVRFPDAFAVDSHA